MKCDIFNIWSGYKDGLKGYIGKRVRDRNDVNDILQTVLVKFAKYCETKNDVQHIKGWLYRITQNAITDYYSRSKRIINYQHTDSVTQGAYEFDDNIFIWLHNFIDSLPVKYSVPLKLCDLDRKPQKEIANQLGLTLEATKSRVQRARKMLKEKFDECGVVERDENQMFYTVTKSCCLK